MGLDKHPARLVAASRAAGDLLDLLEAALRRAEIAAGEAEVRVDDADQRQVGEVIALGHQLRADDDVDRAGFHLRRRTRPRGRRPDRVGGDDRRSRFREKRGDLVGDPLDAGAAGDEAVFLAAFGAGLGRRHDVAAMVAGEAVHQPVLDHPRRAIGALEAMPAVAAQGQRREAAAVEEQQRLLAALEVGFQLGDQSSAPASGRAAAGPRSGRSRGFRACSPRRSARLSVTSR